MCLWFDALRLLTTGWKRRTTLSEFRAIARDESKGPGSRGEYRGLARWDPVSEVVLREIYRCAQPKQKKLLDVIDRYDSEVLDYSEEADQLAEIYIKNGVIPIKYRDDANHIAVASLHNCDVLSWNFQYIVKVKTKREVAAINLHKGYNTIDIFTPREVVEDD